MNTEERSGSLEQLLRDTPNFETARSARAMAPGGGREKETPLPPEQATFRNLVAAYKKRPGSENQQKFVKKMETIPQLLFLLNSHAKLL